MSIKRRIGLNLKRGLAIRNASEAITYLVHSMPFYAERSNPFSLETSLISSRSCEEIIDEIRSVLYSNETVLIHVSQHVFDGRKGILLFSPMIIRGNRLGKLFSQGPLYSDLRPLTCREREVIVRGCRPDVLDDLHRQSTRGMGRWRFCPH